MASLEVVEKKEAKVLSYDLYVNGIFGRNRTSKFKSIQIAQIDAACEPLPVEELQRKVDVALGPDGIKLKSGGWRVIENPTTVGTTKYADGTVIQSRTILIMGGTERLKGSKG